MTAVAPATGASFFTRTVNGGADQVGGSVIFSGTTENAAANPLYIAPGTGASFAVTGAFYQATQPVSGTVGVSGSVAVTGTFFQATQPISAAALPLPTGASTSANQSTGNTSLASIDGKTPALVSGAVPVVDASLATLITSSNTKLDTLNTSINTSGPLPAGTNVIGGVTQSGTWTMNTTPTGLSPGSASMAVLQGTATTTSAVLVAARTGRQSVTIINEGTTAFRVGPSGVTASTGILVPGILGASITLQTAAAVAVVTASGTAAVSYIELF